MKSRVALLALVSALLCSVTFMTAARAEVSEVTIADQFGIAYLPLMVMQERKLLEKHAQAAGLGALKVNWARFGGGGMMNDALLSGSVHFAVGGVPSLVLIWEKTRGSMDVRGVSAINNAPLYLNTRNPNIRSIRDFTPKDRIALPSVKVSVQAITLQMAAAREFGDENFARLDALTVSMRHPDAMQALLSGAGEITAHFTSPPFQYQQLERPGIRRALSSKDIIGDTSFIVAYTTARFHKENPKVYAAFNRAMEEAIQFIKGDKNSAALTYAKMTNTKSADVPGLVSILNDPDFVFTTTPKGVMKYAEFMHKVGTIKTRPASWKDLFFPNMHALEGS